MLVTHKTTRVRMIIPFKLFLRQTAVSHDRKKNIYIVTVRISSDGYTVSSKYQVVVCPVEIRFLYTTVNTVQRIDIILCKYHCTKTTVIFGVYVRRLYTLLWFAVCRPWLKIRPKDLCTYCAWYGHRTRCVSRVVRDTLSLMFLRRSMPFCRANVIAILLPVI